MADIDFYKKLICDMVLEIHDDQLIRHIYSILYRARKRAGS